MPTVFGRTIAKESLIESVGDMSQICGIHSFIYDDGLAKGVRCLDFRNASGLRFQVLPDRGMDIYYAEYKGIPLNWLSGTGVVSSHYYSSHEWDWLRNFFGGLLVTCGLSNVGDHCVDRGAYLEKEHFGAHGRISNLPAKAVSYKSYWDNENYILQVEGNVIEAAAQGENFQLTRRIQTQMGKPSIHISDSVQNRSFYTVPHMFLYHINIGYPLLDEASEIYMSYTHIQGLDIEAEKNCGEIGHLSMPDEKALELVYMIDQRSDENGYCHVMFANRSLENNAGLGISLSYQKSAFPYFTLWKRLNRGEYVIGFEPGNCTVQGRNMQRNRGDLRHLKPQETCHYDTEIALLTSNEIIDQYQSTYGLQKL